MPAKALDLTNFKNGKLTFLKRIGSKDGKAIWLTKCECGKSSVVCAKNRLRIKSCGCLHGKNLSELQKTHGMTKSREFKCWTLMRGRCCCSKNASYKNYGALGIKVCEEWAHDFIQFFEDMGSCPSGNTLDRIDNTKGYCKENCRWATVIQQHRNTRKNVFIELNNERLCIAEWAEKFNFGYNKFYNMVIKYGLEYSINFYSNKR